MKDLLEKLKENCRVIYDRDNFGYLKSDDIERYIKNLEEWRDIKTAPLNGESILIKNKGEVIQAAFHYGKWEEEKDWGNHELTMPNDDLNPTHWKTLN